MQLFYAVIRSLKLRNISIPARNDETETLHPMGHSTLKMTPHYARLIDDDLPTAYKERGLWVSKVLTLICLNAIVSI